MEARRCQPPVPLSLQGALPNAETNTSLALSAVVLAGSCFSMLLQRFGLLNAAPICNAVIDEPAISEANS